MSVVGGCSQLIDATLYLKREDGVICDGWKETLGFHGGGEIGDVGSLAAADILGPMSGFRPFSLGNVG